MIDVWPTIIKGVGGYEWEGARGEIILQTVLTTLEDYFQDVVGCKFNKKVSDAS